MKKLEDVFNKIANGLNFVAIAALVVMISITLLNVFLKNLFSAPIPGAIEIARMMMVCMSPSFAACLMLNRHVNVGLIVDRLSRKGQLAFDVIGYSLSAWLCSLMFYQGIVMTIRRMGEKQVYTSLGIPTWPFYLIFAVSMGVFAVTIVVKLILNFKDKDRYSQPPEPEDTDSLETVNLGEEGKV